MFLQVPVQPLWRVDWWNRSHPSNNRCWLHLRCIFNGQYVLTEDALDFSHGLARRAQDTAEDWFLNCTLCGCVLFLHFSGFSTLPCCTWATVEFALASQGNVWKVRLCECIWVCVTVKHCQVFGGGGFLHMFIWVVSCVGLLYFLLLLMF